ncbi:PEGA domain-containing protein [TM7 phylum sp. oral taxon 348]|nr:PEGA domain-containing protein [TM7 phylum sp. oral taxon 348]
MYYLSSRKKKLAKKLFFMALTAVSIVIGVTVLTALMLGYSFNFNGTEGHVERIGILQVDSKPNGAEVYLNNQRHSTNTRARIAPIEGDYNLRIQKENYRTWQKQVKVKGGEITWVAYPRLIPNKLSPQSVLDLPKNTPLYTTKNSPSQHTKNQTKQNQNTIHNPKDSDIYTEHPIAKVAQIRQAERKNIATNNKPVLKTARQIKEEVISEALANAPKQDRHQIKQPKLWGKAKLIGGLSAGLISAAAIAYTAYSQIPSFSMGIVNAQSGIQASYPGYIPGSFKVNGPIFGEEGRVQINFKSTTNDDEFKLVQVNSNWDSESLLTNYVKDKSKGHYQTDNERGISVYSYKNGGAWVSGGILHIIDGTAQLGPDQIKRIASSLK